MNTGLTGAIAFLIAAGITGAAAGPARAADAAVQVAYSGAIVYAVGAPFPGVRVGTPIHYRLVFHTDYLVDHTASLDQFLKDSNAPVLFSNFVAASLSDDPDASLSFSFGRLSFNRYDALGYGTPGGGGPGDLGSGDFPTADFSNGQFLGVGGHFYANSVYVDADPVAYIEGGIPTPFVAIQFDNDSNAIGEAFGYFDPSSVQISSVPEPAAWAVMLLGLGGLGTALRSARRRRPRPSSVAC
jgi:hypothetical protein